MQRTTFRSVTVAGALVAMIVAGAPAATATEDPVEATSALVAEVAPDQGEVLTGTVSDEAVVTDAGGTEVAIPLDPAQPITLDGGTGTTPALEVHLPTEVNVEKAEVADDGTVVYQATDDGATAAVQTLADGSVRLQTLTPDANGPHEFTYTFGNNITPVEGEYGIELLQDNGGFAVVVGRVDDAWATDADGTPVQTTYRIEDDALIQVIDADDDTNYPIVADPKVTRDWWNTTTYFNRNETAVLAGGGSGAAAIAASIGGPVGAAISAILGVGSAYIWTIHAQGKCVKAVSYGHIGAAWQPYAGKEAGGYCR